MERLTYDCYFGDIHWWHVKGAGSLGCRQVCEEQEENGNGIDNWAACRGYLRMHRGGQSILQFVPGSGRV